MYDWHQLLTCALQPALRGNSFWERRIDSLIEGFSAFGLHLAVLVEPYLQYILDGTKTVESRFSKHRIAPYGCVKRNDVVLLKRSGGPIMGVCQVTDVWYYQLEPKSWRKIQSDFSEMLCAQDPTFWSKRKSASYATLMGLKHVLKITPVNCTKRDRRGWVVLKPL